MKLRAAWTVLALAIALLLSPRSAAAQHKVTLTFTASSDATAGTANGYNAYRLTGSCPAVAPATVAAALTAGWTKVGSVAGTASASAATTISDATVTPGAYCYFATTYEGSAESVPSNIVAAVILPLPPGSVVVSSAQ